MPIFARDGVSLYYEEHGGGFPLLLLAPGGMRSSIPYWERQPFHPVRELSSRFRVIAMDQRNAGRSVAPVEDGDGWDTYAADQIALLDHLGIARCLIMGGCIGGAFALKLIERAGERVVAAVLQQPIGASPDNRDVFYDLFDDWAREVRGAKPDVTPPAWAAFRERMYGGDFTFSVTREFARTVTTPLLVLMGNDVYHPSAISREVASLARTAELVERWRDADVIPQTIARVRAFLAAHAPT